MIRPTWRQDVWKPASRKARANQKKKEKKPANQRARPKSLCKEEVMAASPRAHGKRKDTAPDHGRRRDGALEKERARHQSGRALAWQGRRARSQLQMIVHEESGERETKGAPTALVMTVNRV